MDPDPIQLSLTRAEAIVLVQFLMRYRDKERLEIDHPAEDQLLYDLCAIIEQKVPELLDPSWTAILDRARAEVLVDPE